MLEFYEPGAAIIEDSIAKAVERVNRTNKRVLDFVFGAQQAMLEEVIFGQRDPRSGASGNEPAR